MQTFKIYLKANRTKVITLLLFTLLISYLNFVIYDKLDSFFKEITGGTLSFDFNIVAILIFLYFLLLGINILSNLIEVKLLQKGISNLLNFFMKKVFYGEDVYTLNQNSNLLLSKATMSCNSISKYYTSIIKIVSSVIILIAYGSIIAQIDSTVLILCILLTPLIILCTIGIKQKITHYQTRFFDHSKNRTSRVLDAFGNIKNIKVKNEYDLFKRKILNEQLSLKKNTTIYTSFYSYFDSIVNFIISLAPLLVIYTYIFFLKNNTLSSAEILILFIFIPMFLYSFSNLYSIFRDYFECKPYLLTYKEIYDLDTELTGNRIIKEFEVLQTENLTVQLDNARELKIPDMIVKKGEKVLIVGKSGIGKSSFFNILLGFIKSYEGTISVNAVNLKEYDIKSIRNVFGISFQNNGLFSLSLEDNITLGSKVEFESILNLCRLDKLKNDSNSVINKNQLSGGEKSRISLAQNLIRNPDVVLIDESFSSLDECNVDLIMRAIQKKYKESTIICISHNLSLEKYFDRTISFEEGSVSIEKC
ncbi:ABC transporter ATP-binding protein [Proteiniborus sp. MB09-C3]|uniref:ATP-binding cassette domain-containing protein n=1 Tax=Proteiniborus sp. MB09-C3 TaxID=3050072 RepID=UPI002554D829|nr:ABC transporter ATP-binding protein [Proteiniborus sp. MB09-C3]WIV13845.1 ABC transporter ATP-binding protein [Proteiniborus sp. MB09-C3]